MTDGANFVAHPSKILDGQRPMDATANEGFVENYEFGSMYFSFRTFFQSYWLNFWWPVSLHLQAELWFL